MRYYTKEWYDLIQRAGQTAGLRKVPDKKYTKKDIDVLYDKTLRREMAATRKAYDTAPDLSYLLDILDEHGFNADDWSILDPRTGQQVVPASEEDVRKVILEEQQAQMDTFNAREPFSEDEFREMFREVQEERRAELRYGTGNALLDSVDKRLLALELVPESVYSALKEDERAAKKELGRIERNAVRALRRQVVPADIAMGFDLHDCDLLSVKKKGRNLEMIFCTEGMEGPGERPFRKIVFKYAEVLERDKGITIRTHSHDHEECCSHDHDDCGHEHHHHGDCVHSNCTFLTSEEYNVKNAYEVHMLLWMPSGLKYLTVKAADIEVLDGAEFPEQ